MARKWLRLLLVSGLVSVLLQSTFCRGAEDDDTLTLDAWVAAMGAPAPAPRRSSSSLLSHRIALLDGEKSAPETKDVAKNKTEERNEHEITNSPEENARNSTSVVLTQQGSKEELSSVALNKEELSSVALKKEELRSVALKKEELSSTALNNEDTNLDSTKRADESQDDKVGDEAEDMASSASEKHVTILLINEEEELLPSQSKNTTSPKETSTAVSLIPDKVSGVHRQPSRQASDYHRKEEEVTSSSSTSVATSRMLLVTDGSTSPSNLTVNVDMLKWRLTDTNLLDDIANIMGNEKGETKANPNRSGETSDDSKPKFTKAASEVVETRVLPPGDFDNGIKKPPRIEQGSWASLSPKERLLLRQKLMKDLETSYNVPLPSRIRYRLKKKPSVYTSKKPNSNSRFDVGIPDIYETEVQVTPKYRKKPLESRGAADNNHQLYLPSPAGPSYVPLGALVTPAYDEQESPVTKPYIPLNRSPQTENVAGLVFRPPRRPPGINRRRTEGLLRRPTPGRPYYFTTVSDRVSLQAHLQYRRPVSFKFKRTSNNQDYHGDSLTDPTTRVYTTEPYPTPGAPYATPGAPYHETGSSPYHESTTAGYAKPPEKYIPPTNDYVPPKPPHPTTLSYDPTVSKEPYAGVSQKYIPPSKEYETPKSTHPVPVTYTEPPQKYIPPSKEYIPPHATPEAYGKPSTAEYQTPSTEYVTPKITLDPVTDYHKEPPQKYIPPNKEYASPHIDHKPYDQPPSTNYELPSKEYIPPKSLRIPILNHKSPHKEYAEPPRKYLPPNKEYAGAPADEKHTGGDYTPPPRKYLPPDKHYLTPQRTPESGQPHRRRRPGKRRRKHRKRPTPPSQQYIPPSKDEYHEAKEPSEYKEPERNYEPPNKEYIPPKAPSVTTSLPTSYSTPARTYLPPVEDYKVPHQSHATPSSQYEPPSDEYIPPLQPTTPAGLYETPIPTYGPPSQKYELPSRDYILPARPESYDTSLPSWLMSLQGKAPSAVEEKARPYTTNPTPPPGYHPKHSTREEHFPSTHPGHSHSSPAYDHVSHKPGYHAPIPTYAPPDKEYHVPDVTYVPPIHEAPGYLPTSPKPGYHAPEPSYLPSKPGYHAPEPTYAPPKSDHHTVEQEYIPPKVDYPTPTHHSSPKPGYHAPEPTYVPPKADYHTPEPEHPSHEQGYHYSSPKPGYHAPEPTYAPPHPGYHAPEPTYAPPKPEHPKESYIPPRHDYNVPETKYVPPDDDFHPPKYVLSTPKPRYPAPGLTYIPPKHEFYTPEPSYESHKPGYHAPEPTYAPPKDEYASPEPTYTAPKPGYHEPEQTYLGPKGGQPIASHPEHKPGYHAPEPTYKPPIHDHHHEAGYHAPKPTYKPPDYPITTLTPTYAPPPRTYVPPVSEYLPPKKDYHTTPAYIPPKSPEDTYVPPKLPEVLIPKTPYAPPPPPPLHLPIDLTYLPPEKDYHAPAPHLPVTPSPVYTSTIVYVPEKEYVPPKTTPAPDYVAPIPPKKEYIPPPAITIEPNHDPPLKIPHVHHVTTYKPNLNAKVQSLQDFSYPGERKVSPHTALPHLIGNISSTTYSPPIYTPTTYGPGYNDLPPSVKPPVYPPDHVLDLYDDYDDYYYYYDDDDDYYYYDDDDDDYYYYYYDDDYDYALAPLKKPVPHHLVPQLDYDILDNEIYDFGYIAGIPGRAGRDYPILSYIPLTSFGCDLVADYPGYYADMEAGCQVFHICHRSGRQDSFLCPNGTIFNQKYFVCDWWYNFACEDAPFFYPVNAALGHPGVPLHRNAFEPDLEAARNLPPLERNQPLRDHLHLLGHVTAAVPHLVSPSPHHVLTVAPHHS